MLSWIRVLRLREGVVIRGTAEHPSCVKEGETSNRVIFIQ